MRYVLAVAGFMAVAGCGRGLPVDTSEIKALTTEQAEAVLSRHQGMQGDWPLLLNGLTTLSNEAAEALAQDKGDLVLNGLTALDADLANALARHEGKLFLDGLNGLSDEVAAALRAHPKIVLPDPFKR